MFFAKIGQKFAYNTNNMCNVEPCAHQEKLHFVQRELLASQGISD